MDTKLPEKDSLHRKIVLQKQHVFDFIRIGNSFICSCSFRYFDHFRAFAHRLATLIYATARTIASISNDI